MVRMTSRSLFSVGDKMPLLVLMLLLTAAAAESNSNKGDVSPQQQQHDTRRSLFFFNKKPPALDLGIDHFNLINTLTNTVVGGKPLVNNQVIVVDDIPGMSTPSFSIQAIVASPGATKALMFAQNTTGTNKRTSHKEIKAPYALCGNIGTNKYTTCTSLGLGTHSVTGTPYTSRRIAREQRRTTRGDTKTITFTIVQSKAPVASPVAMPVAAIATSAPKAAAADAPIPTAPQVSTPVLATAAPAGTPPIPTVVVAPVAGPAPTGSAPKVPPTTVVIAPKAAPIAAPVSPPRIVTDPAPVSPKTPSASNTAPVTASAPTKVPTKAPTKAPTKVPTMAPTKAPTKAPTRSPTKAPTAAPIPSCTIPQLAGNAWTDGRPYPLNVAEAQGMMIGNIFVVYGGFYKEFQNATNTTHTLDTSNPTATWQQVDDVPIGPGLTHGAHVQIGSKIYNCGGYVGGHPGLHTSKCLVYDQAQPLGQRWSEIAPLPSGRGGGSMFYNAQLQTMYYVSGAQRYLDKWLDTLDFNTVWGYSFQNASAGWIRKADLPYAANHMMAVTTKDGTGKERHYAFGGQYREDEPNGNYKQHYEYLALNDTWIERTFMPYARAHATSSTHSFGCGFITVAGNTNGNLIISNVTYYSTETDTWTNLGNVPHELNTPICDINRNTNVLYCETGRLWTTRSYTRQLLQ